MLWMSGTQQAATYIERTGRTALEWNECNITRLVRMRPRIHSEFSAGSVLRSAIHVDFNANANLQPSRHVFAAP